jgi:hypothetical protein
MFFKKRSQIKDNTTQTDDGSKSSDGNNKEAFKVGSASERDFIHFRWETPEHFMNSKDK